MKENIELIVRTGEQQRLHDIAVAKTAIEIFQIERKANMEDTERAQLAFLVEERFPSYNTKYYLHKFRSAIKDGQFGSFDRFNNHIASYSELKDFLFGK